MASKTKPKRTAISKAKSSTKTSSKTTKKVSKKSSSKKADISPQRTNGAEYINIVYGLISAVAVYVFALWAIDSGSLWVYAFTFTAVYYTVHFFRLFIRSKFLNNDKTRKAR